MITVAALARYRLEADFECSLAAIDGPSPVCPPHSRLAEFQPEAPSPGPARMIVTGGENVYSGEVEAVIYRHPSVSEAAIFGIPDPQWGEVVAALVVLKPGATLTAEELIAYCRRFLANYKVPRRVEFSETELPKSGSGKILKRILRERFWNRQERAVS